MTSKSSYRRIIILFIITGIAFSLGGMLIFAKYFTYGVTITIVGLLLILRLLQVYKQTNRDIAFFFDAVRNNDSTFSFPVSLGNPSLQKLHDSLNLLNKHIQNIQLKSEFKENYFKVIIKQSNTGIIILDSNNDIELINEAACNFAGIVVSSTNLNLLKIKNKRFYEAICALKPGENLTYKNLNNSLELLLFKATEIRNLGNVLKLVSIQDIKNELDEREVESYQTLIRTLTHEIMNSLSPLTSISKTLNGIYQKNGKIIQPEEISEMHINTTIQGLRAIEDQSSGILNFVNNYRKLTKIHQPVFRDIDVVEWIEQLTLLYFETFADENISFETHFDEKLKFIQGDKNLLNQVLVNLINNAIDAVLENTGKKTIKIEMYKGLKNVIIKVGNNGPLITPETIDKIFVPFYTTKENGSGIGLSISRQILKLHNGTLSVLSNEKRGTVFILEFQPE